MEFLNIFKKFLAKKRKERFNPELSLEDCLKFGLLTKEEKLRIERDRAIDEWEKEIEKSTKEIKKKKK